MAHPNADLAKQLDAWERTGADPEGAVRDGKRKGFVVVVDDKNVISGKGREFLAKWLGGRR